MEIGPEIPIQPEIISPTSPFLEKDPAKPELLKAIEKLKGELAEKDKQLKSKNSEISLLTNENEKLKAINQQKDQQLAKYKEKLKDLSIKNNSLLQNYTRLKNPTKNVSGNQVKDNQTPTEPPKEKSIRKILLNSGENSPNNLSKIKEPKNNLLAVKENLQDQLQAQIQV